MKTNNFQVQICKTSKTKDGNLTQEVPTFILPECLGLLKACACRSVVEEMFAGSEVHGSICRLDSGGLPDPISILLNESDSYLTF